LIFISVNSKSTIVQKELTLCVTLKELPEQQLAMKADSPRPEMLLP